MKYQITRQNEVGEANHDWLHAKHYFSFANYYNPEKMGFGMLRVINDDSIAPGSGFNTHPHRDMEIITIPLSGSIRHKDNMGNEGVIKRGEVQVMSAGRGVLHSEFNNSDKEQLRLFQVWIEPNEQRVDPSYDQREFDFVSNKGQWTQLVSPISLPDESGLKIHQNAFISGTSLTANQGIGYTLKDPSHGVYILVAEGEISISEQILNRRDSIAISKVKSIDIKAKAEAEVFIFEVPMG